MEKISEIICSCGKRWPVYVHDNTGSLIGSTLVHNCDKLSVRAVAGTLRRHYIIKEPLTV